MKAHLAISPDTRLKEGQDQVALCGQIVPKARFVFLWDYFFPALFATALNRVNTCEKCIAKVGEITSGTVYGLVQGSAEKDLEVA